MQKTLDVRACLPRGALAFSFSGHFPLPTYSLPTYFSLISPVPAPRNFLRVRTGGPGGSPNHIRRSPPRSAFLHPRTQPSPPTPPDGRASRPRRGPQRTQANNASESPATFTEFSHLNFFLSPRSIVASLLGSVYNLHFGAARVHDNKSKTRCFPSNAPTNRILHKNTISRCQGNSRSGRPVVVYGAPLNLLPVITHLFPPVGLAPHRLPAPPFTEITTCRYHLPTSISLDLHAHGGQHDPLISQAPATITFCIRAF